MLLEHKKEMDKNEIIWREVRFKFVMKQLKLFVPNPLI